MSAGVVLASENVMTIDRRVLAAHVMRAIARARSRVVTVEDIARMVGARRSDVRSVVTRLHEEGYVDALRMRPTLSGLALAVALRSQKLMSARHLEQALARVA
jgi:DNA-binding IclR family transcriptional regulator